MPGTTKRQGGSGKALPENKLAVVVARANELRNVLKLDKQSPFVTLRLQDQETSTRVLPRAGQTPRWDEAHWFSLDGIDLSHDKNRKISVNVYHQKKGDAKLICSADVDYTPALTQSVNHGYDGWFDMYWEGRPAGRVFLEFTYYPRGGEVPIGTESLGRQGMNAGRASGGSGSLGSSGGSGPTAGVRRSLMGGVMKMDELPVLSQVGEEDSQSREKVSREDHKEPEAESTTEGGLFHFLDKKLQSLATRFGPNANGATTDWLALGDDYPDVRRKVESPALIKSAPTNLFADDLDEMDSLGSGLGARSSIAKRQERMLAEATAVGTQDDDDDDDNKAPPPVPRHTVPVKSTMEAPSRKTSEEQPLSWYQRRMQSRRGQ